MPITISEIKKSLENRDRAELLSYCMRMAKFKKENKELLGFLLFQEDDIEEFVARVKEESDLLFREINISNVYFIKKSVRKILRIINKYIRFAGSRQVESELLIYFCNSLIEFSIPLEKSRQLNNIYLAQVKKADAAIATLHPDLQYDLTKQKRLK